MYLENLTKADILTSLDNLFEGRLIIGKPIKQNPQIVRFRISKKMNENQSFGLSITTY